MNSTNNEIIHPAPAGSHSLTDQARVKDMNMDDSQLDPSDELSSVTTSVESSSTTTQNVNTISETAVPPETQFSGENSNPSQMETQSESDGSDTEHFSDAISNRGENHVAIRLVQPQQQIKTNLLTMQQQQRTIMRPKWPRNQTISVPQMMKKSPL